ncbi:MAG: MBL fold metallo-hydrolase [Candidatus Hodarchaeota archaeon]
MFSFTYFGYAAILVQLEKHLLFDPGIIDGKPLVDVTKVHPAYVLVSQTSSEHIGNASEFPRKQGSLIIGTVQVLDLIRKAGVAGYAVAELKNNETKQLGGNIQLTGYLLRRSGFLASRSLAFEVKSTQGCITYLGKAKEIGPFTDTQPDLLCVAVGDKLGGSLSPEEAVKVTQAIDPRYALPICGNALQRTRYITLIQASGSATTPINLQMGDTFTLL